MPEEGSYNEKLDIIGCDFVQNCSDKSQTKQVQDRMYFLGATIDPVTKRMPGYAFSFCFEKESILKRAKERYFSSRFEKLRSTVKTLTLEAIIERAPSLDCICNNEYSDAVELYDQEEGDNGTFITMDDFIRRIRPGVTYYVSESTVLMH